MTHWVTPEQEMTSPRDPRTTNEVRIQTRTAEMYRMITMRIMERAACQRQRTA